jgi:hypothetical protein
LLLLLEVRRDWLPDDREREPPEALEDPVERDAGGEDVRVAMRLRLRDRHTSHRHHTPDTGVGESGRMGSARTTA